MKFSKLLIIILIVFFKTGNVFSDNSIFDVNNIKIEKTAKLTNEQLANQAIKKGFEELKKKILLDSPNVGVYIPNGIWREMNNFSKNSVCLVLASENYDENDYIRNYQDFIKMS